jgi:glycosyl transferase family 2
MSDQRAMEPLEGAGMRELPAVTVMMAVYNYAGFVRRSLDSALAQDYPAERLRFVIVDDGSTDATPDVLAEYERANPGRFTIIRQANAGYVAATNTAAAAAAAHAGSLLTILDADDLWPPDKVRRQVARLLKQPQVGLVYCDTEVIDPYDVVHHKSVWEWREQKPQRGPDAYTEIMSAPGNIALSSTILFRSELAERVFPIPPAVPYQDWWITARVAAIAEIDYIEGMKVGYRLHGANMTFGATGLNEVRESCKTAEMRRQILVHGGGDPLDEKGLIIAWQAWENSGRVAVSQASSAYVPLLESSAAEREQGARHAAVAERATLEGDLRLALRERISALACNPLDSVSRQWVHDLAWLARPDKYQPLQGDPLIDARRFVTLAYAEELVSEPQLLSAYASVIRDDDDATLAVAAVGLGNERAVGAIMAAADRVGLNPGELPDVLLVTQGGPAVAVELERRAHAVLTRRSAKLTAPAFRPEHVSELRALVAS